MKTMNQLIDEYLAAMKAGPMRASTRYLYSHCAKKYIAPRIGSLPIAEVDSAVLDRVVRNVADTVGFTAARCCTSTLHQMFKMAVQDGHITVSPMVGPAAALRRPARRQVLDAGRYAELRKVIVAWEQGPSLDIPRNQELHEVTDFLFHTGVRPSELFALRWNNVDLLASPATAFINAAVSREGHGGAVIRDHPKTRDDIRNVIIPIPIAEQLQERHARQAAAATPNPLNLVFPSPTGTVWDSNKLRKILREIVRPRGYGAVNLMTFRHAGLGS